MEFLIVFVVSFIVLIGVSLAFVFGKPPTYRPARSEILQLLVDVSESNASMERWELFLSLPIAHDPPLDQIRQECLDILDDSNIGMLKHEGINGAILDKEGMLKLREISARLHQLIKADEGSKRLF